MKHRIFYNYGKPVENEPKILGGKNSLLIVGGGGKRKRMELKTIPIRIRF